jgi:Na+-translocating ferredoxin:NAD+ oxidoreductase RNF subunit RnfB
MDFIKELLPTALVFIGLGALMGILLAVAAKVFKVEKDEKVELIAECLPGANCGGCGYTGCAALAGAISQGKAPVNACNSVSDEVVEKIAEVMGVKAEKSVRYRAQVMCSGTHEFAKKKYIYNGIADCAAAMKLAGGDKLCPNGCIGLGTCAAACKFDAIHIINGVAAVDYEKCVACGVCVSSCPKGIIKLIPYDSKHWVGCMSADKGAITKNYCDVGCIGCKICEKACPNEAIKVENNLASINYELCNGCGSCIEKCPRNIIWSDRTESDDGIIKFRQDLTT